MFLLEEINIDLIENEAIRDINYRLVGAKTDNEKYKSSMSSFYYYEKDEEQISSIILSIIKGHYFIDGNKRTAFAVFMILCDINNIKINKTDEELARLFIKIAKNNYSVREVSSLLFENI